MYTVYQGETGGYLLFSYSNIPAVSGFLQLIGRDQVSYLIDGFVASGNLYIPKEIINYLPPSEYIGYPQLVDSSDDNYFLTPIDLEVQYVPHSPIGYITILPSIQVRLDDLTNQVIYYSDHGHLSGLSDDDHTQYLNESRGDARYSLLGHIHDDRYYTEAEVDALLAGFGSGSPFIAANDADVPLIARGHSAGQTGDLQQWQASGGTPKAWIDSAGSIKNAPTLTLSGDAFETVFTLSPATENRNGYGINIYGADDGTSLNVCEIVGVIGGVEHYGSSLSGGYYGLAGLGFYAYGYGHEDSINGAVVEAGSFGGTADIVRGVWIPGIYTDGVTEAYGIRIENVAGATNNYALWTNGGTVVHKTGTAATKGVVVQGAASQSANLQEWQNSGNTVLSRVSATGDMYAPRIALAAGQVERDDGTDGVENLVGIYKHYTDIDMFGHPGSLAGVRSELDLDDQTSAATTTGSANGVFGSVYVYGTATKVPTAAYGLNFVVYNESPQGSTYAIGVQTGALAGSAGPGTIDELYGGLLYIDNYGSQQQPIGVGLNIDPGNVSQGGFAYMAGIRVETPDTTNVGTYYALDTLYGQVLHKTGASTEKGLVVQGAASQSANLQEWQNSSGTALSWVNPSGGIVAHAHSAMGSGAVVDADYFGSTWSQILRVTDGTVTDLSMDIYSAIGGYLEFDPAVDPVASIYTLNFENHVLGSKDFQTTEGIFAGSYHDGTGTITHLVGSDSQSVNTSTGTVTHAQAAFTSVSNYGFGTIGEAVALEGRINSYDNSPINIATGISLLFGADTVGYGTLYGIRIRQGDTLVAPTTSYGVWIDSLGGSSQYAIWTDGGHVRHKAGAAAVVPMSLQRAASQSADMFRLLDSDGSSILHRINKDGYAIISRNSAPADSDLAAGDMVLWFDKTNGAAKLKIKAKQADGTVKTGEVVLA